MPPAQWAQAVLPALFVGLEGDTAAPFWGEQATTGGEAIFYVGTVPLILAAIGWAGGGDGRALRPWKWIAVGAALMASLPRLWPAGYMPVLAVPGLGWFRAPGRYAVLTSLALALLAGRGLDRRTIPEVRFRLGLAAALTLALLGFAVGWMVTGWPSYRASVSAGTIWARFGVSALAWAVSVGVVWLWRRGVVGWAGPLGVAAVELGVLFYQVPVQWGWDPPDPASSPTFGWLSRSGDAGLVAGMLKNVPVRAGLVPAYPYVGVTAPPPIYLLEACEALESPPSDRSMRLMRRFGVTHAVWRPEDRLAGEEEILYSGSDEVLDRLLRPRRPLGGEWKVTSIEGSMPPALAATRFRVTREPAEFGWAELFGWLMGEDRSDVALYQRGEEPADRSGERARRAVVESWDARRAVVDQDGTSDLIIRRTWYPGWSARVDGGPWEKVHKVNGGLQAVRVPGAGRHEVEFRYTPTHLGIGGSISLIAIGASLGMVAWSAFGPARPGETGPR
jgi:hypothetical protein